MNLYWFSLLKLLFFFHAFKHISSISEAVSLCISELHSLKHLSYDYNYTNQESIKEKLNVQLGHFLK